MPQALRSVLPGPAASRGAARRVAGDAQQQPGWWLVRTLQLATLKNGHNF